MPKARLDAERITLGAIPVPVSEKLCGLPGASSVIVTTAARAPVPVGEKTTLTTQVEPAAIPVPQLSVWLKSPAFVPESAIPLIVSA